MQSGQSVLIDANVIIEAHGVKIWPVLAGAFKLETVEQCVIETQTGMQYRRPELLIDEKKLRDSLHVVHPVTDLQIAKVMLSGGATLDAGEQALWAHALTRQDAWILCGPDKASMKFGFHMGHRERLISLGALLSEINVKSVIRSHFSKNWLDRFLNDLALGIIK